MRCLFPMKTTLTLLFCLASFTPSFAAEPLRSGLSAEQLVTLKGQPYYQTEHYSQRKGEQVWLYTKKKEEKSVDEKNITDAETQWPTLYRKTVTRTCEVGDIFVEVSQGIVKSIIPANTAMAYGPCVVETLEEFLPIVDGKPSEAKARKTTNTTLEKNSSTK